MKLSPTGRGRFATRTVERRPAFRFPVVSTPDFASELNTYAQQFGFDNRSQFVRTACLEYVERRKVAQHV